MSKDNFLSLQISEEEILQAAHIRKRQFMTVLKQEYSFLWTSEPLLSIGFAGVFAPYACGFFGGMFTYFLGVNFFGIEPYSDNEDKLIFIANSTGFILFFVTLIICCIRLRQVFDNEKKKEKKKWDKIVTLYQKTKDFNSLIDGVDALDEADRSSGKKRLKNREEVMEAFTIMRADLICAVRIEKTFRENPNLRSTDFNMNLEPLKILQISDEASQYGDLFSQALQIGMSVQEEMQALQKKS